VCFLILLTDCSVIGTPYKSKQSIAEYAELLFKRQNFLTQQVMMNFDEDIALIDQERIAQAEEQMHDACYLLVEYANREMEGKKMSVFFRRRVKKSFDSCDESVKHLEAILIEVN
jgi:hypothetical protein